jgi:hypothetical protein
MEIFHIHSSLKVILIAIEEQVFLDYEYPYGIDYFYVTHYFDGVQRLASLYEDVYNKYSSIIVP